MYKSRRRRISRRSSFDVLRVARVYLEAIDSPKSLGIWLRLKYGESVLHEKVDPMDYLDHVSFHKDYCAVKFLSKFDGFGNPSDRRQAALDSFWDYEKHCRQTNHRLRLNPYPPGAVGDAIVSASGKIRALLGDVPISDILDKGSWGPGVTSSQKGKFLSAYNKFDSHIDLTPSLVPFWDALRREYPIWVGRAEFFCVVPWNKVTTVPKNSKTDRTIAIEPHLNAFLQRGVGKVIGSRLRRWGVTLNDQERNRDLARASSLSGAYSTVDLKGASDTVSIEAARLLLPSEWFHLLDILRSTHFELNGKIFRYEKLSSMGNGYTFEVESLIFCSLVKAVYQVLDISSEYRVYGDDLIVDSRALPLLREVLAHLGFIVNEEKTFSSSPFRESCGGDFFNGVEVSPFYLRKSGDIVQLITFANWLRVGSPYWLPIGKVWRYLYHAVPKQWANKGPFGLADSIFWVNYEEWDPLFEFHRRPYGPVVGYRILVPSFEPVNQGVPDRSSAIAAHLYIHRDRRSFFSYLMDGDFPDFRRVSVGREVGSWVLRSLILTDEWPSVRWL